MQTIQIKLPDSIAMTFDQACLGSEKVQQTISAGIDNSLFRRY